VDEADLRAPVERVHFAGEYAAGAWSALMEGALRTGRSAAAEICEMRVASPSGALS
jgi:monoamine oxidase